MRIKLHLTMNYSYCDYILHLQVSNMNRKLNPISHRMYTSRNKDQKIQLSNVATNFVVVFFCVCSNTFICIDLHMHRFQLRELLYNLINFSLHDRPFFQLVVLYRIYFFLLHYISYVFAIASASCFMVLTHTTQSQAYYIARSAYYSIHSLIALANKRRNKTKEIKQK